MCNWRSAYRSAGAVALFLTMTPAAVRAADIYVPAGGNLQAAIDSAKGGDTIVLQPGATYAGNFKLPVHAGSEYVTIRTAASDQLPADGTRITPAHIPYLATIKSSNTVAAMRTRAGAAYWRLLLLKFDGNVKGYSDVLALGDGSSAQNLMSQIPHHLIVDRVYMSGSVLHGQKRGIALNSADTTIINSWIVEMKAIEQDSQAIGGWNGPGPFRIENNHLEGAGEVFIYGGDDPKITDQQLVPSDLIFRGNTLTRPLIWRNPIMPAPVRVRASASLDGTLAAGTYAYRVMAQRPAGYTTAKSPASFEVTVTVVDGARVTIEWDPVPDATAYVVYGRTPGAQTTSWTVTSTSFTDDGTTAGIAATPSSQGTMWQVKNLFELKHIRRALVAYNLMENNWEQAQQGTAILITPRNQGGNCLWCQVQDVTFEYNTVRHTGSGLKILGWDNEKPSQQTTNVTVRHNEFSDVSTSWGGTGYAFIIIDGPKNVTFDHNTVIAPKGAGVLTTDQRPTEGFTFTNNVARHNSYGISGGGKGFGSTAIAYYFPGGTVTKNVFAAGPASKYPAGNLFPTAAEFEQHFVDYANGDFNLKSGTDWAFAGTDGLNLGADLRAIAAQAELTPPHVTTMSLPTTKESVAYNATLEAEGGRKPYHWTVMSGMLPTGLALNEYTGVVSGIATLNGSYSFTVQVEDSTGAIGTQPFTVQVDRFYAPVQILTEAVVNGMATIPYEHAFEAIGGAGTYVWSVIEGALPLGLSLTPQGVLSGTPVATTGPHAAAAPVTYPFAVRVVDPADSSRWTARQFTLTVFPQPNHGPTVTITSPVDQAVVQVGSTITLTAQPTDEDGTVVRVDYYVGDALIGSASGQTFELPWMVPTSGTYTVKAVAVDDENAMSASTVEIRTQSEIVLRGVQVTNMAGNFKLNPDVTAAGGSSLWLMDKALAKVNTAVAAPAHYAEFTFYAEAGRSYRLWVRGKAERNSYSNDSVHVQFDAVASALIGTTKSMVVNLEDDAAKGVSGWGWQDNGYGVGMLGPEVVFTRTGLQTMRFQNREDGLMIDQIVLSPAQFLTASPGELKDDATILAQ
jgi:hypothetical protein